MRSDSATAASAEGRARRWSPAGDQRGDLLAEDGGGLFRIQLGFDHAAGGDVGRKGRLDEPLAQFGGVEGDQGVGIGDGETVVQSAREGRPRLGLVVVAVAGHHRGVGRFGFGELGLAPLDAAEDLRIALHGRLNVVLRHHFVADDDVVLEGFVERHGLHQSLPVGGLGGLRRRCHRRCRQARRHRARARHSLLDHVSPCRVQGEAACGVSLMGAFAGADPTALRETMPCQARSVSRYPRQRCGRRCRHGG